MPTATAASGCSMPCKPRNLIDSLSHFTNSPMPQTECDNPHLADELLIVRHSGEIPEVALHGSLYYLTSDPDGPTLVLAEAEVKALKGMVVERYREIIQRDLEPSNRDRPFYRGLRRAAVNWRRLEKFCRREGLVVAELQEETGSALLAFLGVEILEVAAKTRQPSSDCQTEELRTFALGVGLNPADLPPGWHTLCTDHDLTRAD